MAAQQSTSSPRSILEEAEGHARHGRYSDAIRVLTQAGVPSETEHAKYWTAMVCSATARNKLHAHDDQGARDVLRLVPGDLRAANPKIDAECHTIDGILLRRQSYRKWKGGARDASLEIARRAIGAFGSAQASAEMALEYRLRHNAVLNRLYALGLLYAIRSESAQRNPGLLVEAIMAEDGSRGSTPPDLRDELTGLTIIADLALGAGIGTDGVAALSNRPGFQSAWRRMRGGGEASWAELILRHVRDVGAGSVRPDAAARALLLGSKMLHADGGRPPQAENLLLQYAARLRRCHLDLRGISADKATLESIEHALRRFPQRILDRVMSPTFLR